MEMGLRASLGWGDFLLLEEEEEGEGERAAAGLCRPDTDGETIVGTRMAFWDAVRVRVCGQMYICNHLATKAFMLLLINCYKPCLF